MTNAKLIEGAQTVSIRKSNGALQTILRAQANAYVARGWALDTVINIGNGVYNVILSKDAA